MKTKNQENKKILKKKKIVISKHDQVKHENQVKQFIKL